MSASFDPVGGNRSHRRRHNALDEISLWLTLAAASSATNQTSALLVLGEDDGQDPHHHPLQTQKQSCSKLAEWPFNFTGSRLAAHHQAGGDGEDVGDGVLHGPRLPVQGEVSEHHAVHQRPQQEVDVAHQDQAQAHLHQGLGLLQRTATKS